VDDPVAAGLVASFARPGGNLTGVSLMATELMPKRLELLSELVPQAQVICLLVKPNNPTTPRTIEDLQEAPRASGLQHPDLTAGAERGREVAFAAARRSSVILPGVRRLRFGSSIRFTRAAVKLSRPSA